MLPDESNFCSRCGAVLSAASTDPDTTGDADISPEISAEVEAELEGSETIQDNSCDELEIDVDVETDCSDEIEAEVETTTKTVTMFEAPVYPVSEEIKNDYHIVISSIGSCPASYADDVITDVLGYTPAESRTIVSLLPAKVAQNLTATQATYIAQALSEYGMMTAIYDSMGYSGSGMKIRGSVYDSDGTLTASAIKVLTTLTAANRLKKFTRWKNLIDITHLFRQNYHRIPPTTWRRPQPVRRYHDNGADTFRRTDSPRRSQPAHQDKGPGRSGSPGRNSGRSGGGPGGDHRR